MKKQYFKFEIPCFVYFEGLDEKNKKPFKTER